MAKPPKQIQALEQLKETAYAARLPSEREAWLNLAFYLGEQYVTWGTDNTLKPIERKRGMENTPRPVFNKIMHFSQQTFAETMQDQPQGDVLPPTDDLSAQEDAKVAKAYIEYVSDATVANYDAQLGRAVLGAIIHNQHYLKWTWNPRLKRVEIIPVPFFEGYPDPFARDWSSWRYFIHAQFMDVEQVYELFGKEVGPTDTQRADSGRTELMRGMGSSPVLSGVTVNEIWYKPCRRYPKGMYAVWAGNEFLVPPTDHPYAHQRLPFTVIGALERPDSQFFQSPVQFLRPAQMAWNQYIAQRIAIRRSFANPKWYIPKELELDEDPNDAPNQILRGYSTSNQLEPKIITPAAFADNQDGHLFEEQMMHIVGVHEVSQAQVPGRVEAAKAIELLKQSDVNRTATLRKTIQQSNSEGWYQALMLAKQFEDESKMVLVTGEDTGPMVKEFRARDISPGVRVRTTMTTGLARTRAAKQDALFRLIELGVLTDPELIAKQLDMPLPSFINHQAADVTLARNENHVLAKGEPIVANSWDMHSVHLREHNTYRKSQAFLMLPTETKQKFEHHCQTHQQMLDAEMQKQAQLMAMAQQDPNAAKQTQGPPA